MAVTRSRHALRLGLAGALLAAVLAALPEGGPSGTGADPTATLVGKSDAAVLASAYRDWAAEYAEGGVDRPIAVELLFNKGLSERYSPAYGHARLDLATGAIAVDVKKIDDPEAISDVWLVDNADREGLSAAPEPGDRLIRAGRLERVGSGREARLRARIDPRDLVGFELNWVVVARRDAHPGEGGTLFGSTTLFERRWHEARVAPRAKAGFLEAAIDSLRPTPLRAQGITPGADALADLLNRGRKIFFAEKFNGNGRTCGTCHREDNNFAIDPEFIATLPATDPLFIAEFPAPNPLAQNFEKPELMRKVGLILENTNGFGDLENNFTMRGVPHTLAMRTSLRPGDDGTAQPPDERTGWSGDGSPVDLSVDPPLLGTLRDFAVGAVRQHFTKTLARQPGVDFRFPTEDELDALEAFQLSLGRQAEFPDLTTVTLFDKIADRGRELFLGDGIIGTPCQVCHRNAGANANFGNQQNFNFNTNVENIADQPADIIDAANNPPDDGFGSPGDTTFNTAVLVEAADTGPFFHNNSVETIEAAVAFYTGPNVGITIMDGSQVRAIGAFLRVLNADENLRSALVLEKKAQGLPLLAQAKVNLALSIEELRDALEVLECGTLHPELEKSILEAIALDERAMTIADQVIRNQVIEQAKTVKEGVRARLIDFN